MTPISELLSFYEKIVHRLMRQYEEYIFLHNIIKELEDKKFIITAKIAKEKNIGIQQAIQEATLHSTVQSLDNTITLYKMDLDHVSDEMTFPNPIIWMMYKEKAYKGTSAEIVTLGDLKKHCEPAGYICTARFAFLCSYVLENKKINFCDDTQFPPDTTLSTFYLNEKITDLLSDVTFMTEWKRREYFIQNNKINKWNISPIK